MGTRKVKLKRTGEKSAVDSLDLVCSFIRNIIHNHRPNSWLAQATDKSDTPLDSPLHEPQRTWLRSADSRSIAACTQLSSLRRLCCHSQSACAIPSNHMQGYASCNILNHGTVHVLRCHSYTETTCTRQNRYSVYKAIQAVNHVWSSADCRTAWGVRIEWGWWAVS